MTPYRGRARPDTSWLRCVLATLVLTALTLVGAAASATGAAPAPTFRSLAAAVTGAAPDSAASQNHSVGHDFRHRAGHDFRHQAGQNAGRNAVQNAEHSSGRNAGHRAGLVSGSDLGRPDQASGAAAGPGAVAQAGHEQPRAAADPAQAPRAGTGRAYLLLHAPPPPHDALTPAAPGPAEPRAGSRRIAADSFDAPGSRRGELPGVRGPPGRTSGPTTGHPSCSADPAPRPH